MISTEKMDFKKKLHQHAVNIISERIKTIVLSMENAQAAANSEEKSSAGDKYETTRAMSHIEKDMHAKQLVANNQELAFLLSIDCDTVHRSVVTGSLIVCKEMSFFIAAGLGKILYEGQKIYMISPVAPVAKSLLNKTAGDRFVFNNEQMIIEEIY